jgi:hypothetical protein
MVRSILVVLGLLSGSEDARLGLCGPTGGGSVQSSSLECGAPVDSVGSKPSGVVLSLPLLRAVRFSGAHPAEEPLNWVDSAFGISLGECLAVRRHSLCNAAPTTALVTLWACAFRLAELFVSLLSLQWGQLCKTRVMPGMVVCGGCVPRIGSLCQRPSVPTRLAVRGFATPTLSWQLMPAVSRRWEALRSRKLLVKPLVPVGGKEVKWECKVGEVILISFARWNC